MERFKYEEKYLLVLIRSILNRTKSPVCSGAMRWEPFFRMTDYQHVTSLAYYGLLGMPRIPKETRNNFYNRYRDGIQKLTWHREAEKQLTAYMESWGIYGVILNSYELTECYPVPEMGYQSEIQVLIEGKQLSEFHALIEQLNYEKKASGDFGEEIYLRVPGVTLTVYTSLHFWERGMRRYYRNFINQLSTRPGYQFVFQMSPSEQYVYQMCRLADNYASGDIDLRQFVNLWVFYDSYMEEIDGRYAGKAFRAGQIMIFSKNVEDLLLLWFDGQIALADDRMEICEAMESYIFTKGEEGREISKKMLPLVKKMADFYWRNRKKELFKKKMEWIFPSSEYMKSIFPILEKHRILLPVYWIYRLIRTKYRVAEENVKNTLQQGKD